MATKNQKLELVNFDQVVNDQKIVIEDAQHGAIRISVVEGLYGVINPTALKEEENGSISLSLPMKIDSLLNCLTSINVNEVTGEVTMTSKNITGEDLVHDSQTKISKKDTSNAVRLAAMAHMAKLVEFGRNLLATNLSEKVLAHDKKVASYFQKQKNPDSVLYFKDLDEAVYQKSKGVSNSQLTKIANSFAHFELSREEEKEATSAMLMGRAIHCLLFTPEIFEESFAVNTNELSGATNEGKFRDLYFDLLSLGKEVLSSKEYKTVTRGRDSFLRHPLAPLLLKEAVFEESFYTMVEGFLFRGRIDCYILKPSQKLREKLLDSGVAVEENESIVLDLKFTNDNNDNEDQYAASVVRSGYHRQGSAYCSLVERQFQRKSVFILMTVESKAPFDVTLFQLDEAFLEVGEIEVTKLLTKYKAHLDNPSLYKGRCAGVKTITAPHWYMQKLGALLQE